MTAQLTQAFGGLGLFLLGGTQEEAVPAPVP